MNSSSRKGKMTLFVKFKLIVSTVDVSTGKIPLPRTVMNKIGVLIIIKTNTCNIKF